MTTIGDSTLPVGADVQPEQVSSLMERVDGLFEQYLHALDQYQKARQELSSQLSSGYLSLAQANFSNKGRRYGQDYYDERMQAQRLVSISSSGDDDEALEFTWEDVKDEVPEDGSAETDNAGTDEVPTEKAKSVPKDPLRWFGVLVPPPLRSAKASFTTAVNGPVLDLITLQQKLRNLEIEIGRARKSIKKLGKV